MNTKDVMLPLLAACAEKMTIARMAKDAGGVDRAAELEREAYAELEQAQARELPRLMAAHARWQWLPGMLCVVLGEDGQPMEEPRRVVTLPAGEWDTWMACDGDAYYQRSMVDHVPVLEDPATAGCLWGLLCDHLRSHRPGWAAAWTGSVAIWRSQDGATIYDGPLVTALLLAWDAEEGAA